MLNNSFILFFVRKHKLNNFTETKLDHRLHWVSNSGANVLPFFLFFTTVGKFLPFIWPEKNNITIIKTEHTSCYFHPRSYFTRRAFNIYRSDIIYSSSILLVISVYTVLLHGNHIVVSIWSKTPFAILRINNIYTFKEIIWIFINTVDYVVDNTCHVAQT